MKLGKFVRSWNEMQTGKVYALQKIGGEYWPFELVDKEYRDRKLTVRSILSQRLKRPTYLFSASYFIKAGRIRRVNINAN